jgi:hypothetical protein
VTLAIQLLACVGAVALIALLLRGDTSRRTMAASAAGVAVVVVSLLGVQSVWTNARSQRATGKAQRALTTAQANMAGGQAIGVNAPFVEWTVRQASSRDNFYLVGQDPTVIQWLSYRMLPHLAVERPQKGTWLVFYGQTPRQAGYKRAQLDDVRTFAPGFEMARFATTGGTG